MTVKIIRRILVSPFILALFLITMLFEVMKMWVDFLRYGGEFTNYDKDTRILIQDVFNFLAEEVSKRNELNNN